MKKFLTCFLSCIVVLLSYLLQAQQDKATTDSLLNILKTDKKDTTQVNTLNVLSRQYINTGNYEQARQYAEQAQLQAKRLNYKKGIANAYNNCGLVFWYQGNYERALDNQLKSLKIKEEIGDKPGIASSYNNIGNIYYYQGNYENALDNYQKSLLIRKAIGDKKGISASYSNIGSVCEKQGNYEKALGNYLKCLKICEEILDKIGISTSYNNIGNIHFHEGNYEKSLNNHLNSLKISQEIGDKQRIAASYNNIGSVYLNQRHFEKALDNHSKSLKIKEEIGDKHGIASSYNNIGNVYEQQGNYEKALDNHLKGVKINEEMQNKSAIAASYNNVGNIYIKQHKLEESYNYLKRSLAISEEIGYKDGVKEAYASLSNLYEKKSDYKQAYNYHQLYSDIKDTLLNEQSSKQIAEMNTKYDSEKKDKELIQKDAEINKQQAETEKQNLQRNAFIIGFVLVLVLAFFIFRGYRQKKNANKLLEEKNSLIENQKLLVEEKNLKITDSINYAKRIQQATLPSQELIKSFFPNSFIFFRPKDIVSGDFYWFTEKVLTHNSKLIIAVADCTGHGVPGAFMSMIGNTLLNEIVNVKNILNPHEILNHLNKGIVSLLRQSNNDSGTQDDGMDITIVAIDKTNNEIEFAGANHFSYLINGNHSQTLKGDVFSIGGMFGKSDINFSGQKIKVEKGSMLYLFSDGFIDQFGGEKCTKFLSNRFEQLLQTIQQKDMDAQREMLITEFDDWKGNNKQLDDVLVVGISL